MQRVQPERKGLWSTAAMPPTNLRATKTDKTFVTIQWAEPAKLGSSIKGYKIKYTGIKPYDKQFGDSGVVDIDSRFQTSQNITNLFPATDYDFKVATKAGCTGLTYTDQLKITTKIDNPPRPNVTKVEDISGTNTQISIIISPASSKNGPISFYQVVVLRSNDEQKRLPEDSESNLTNFNEAAAKNINFYIAFEIPAENVTADSRFTVGDGKMYGSYLNAKLQEGKRYIVFVRAISKENKVIYAGEYSMVAKVSVKKRSSNRGPSGNSAPAIAAGVITACIIVAVIIFAVIFIRRRKSKGRTKADSSESMKLQGVAVQNLSNSNPILVNEEEARYEAVVCEQQATPKSKKKAETDVVENVEGVVLPSAPSLSEMEPVIYSNALEDSHNQPIPVVQFSEYMNRVKGANYARLRQEYNALPKAKQFPWKFAEKLENKKLNRFANIMAYDHSRVPVEPAGGVEYINANYIEGWDGTPKVYIATQGPNAATLSIFWLMVWNEQVGSIVMVTNIVENGKTKCHQYWPENTANYGAIKVSLHKVEAFADFTIRTFILSKNSETRTVKQFHFTVWPDHGVPRMPTNILSLRRRVRRATASNMGPVLVHCSAGVGRTGTYIVIDAMLERAKTQRNVDIHGYMHVVRRGRIHMVQTEDQYVFLHKAILEALTCGNTEINPQDVRRHIKKLEAYSATQGKTSYAIEFERLSVVCPNPGRDECEAAFKQENLKKNRVQDLAPLDISRVLLLRPVVNEGDDYISASFADAYKDRNTFILTQAPLPHTTEDFWQMVSDYSIGSVVMLNNLNENRMTYPRYWPKDVTSEETYGDMKIILTSQERIGEIVHRKFTVQDKKLNRPPKSVYHLQHCAWPNHSIPKNKQSVLRLIERVTAALQQSGNMSFVVQCSDGAGRSGTFCTIYSTLERVKLEQVVDVFQACKVIRARRPAALETLDQYKLCYEIVQEFLDSFSDYSNFDDV